MRKKSNSFDITILVVLGLLISYIMQIGPSPLLMTLRDDFQLQGRDALLNLCVSVIFPFIILGGVIGGYTEQRIGTSRLFILTMIFVTAGSLCNFWIIDFTGFLVGRGILGIGFGLGIPFIGSAIMKWYNPKQRNTMTMINGFFPFVATLITYTLIVPLSTLFNNSWKSAFGFWGILAAAVLILWMLKIHKPMTESDQNIRNSLPEKGVYRGLLKRKSIHILIIVFMCDFFCYSYIATILPSWLFELGGVTETSANMLSAAAFPLLGLLGCGAGGFLSAKSGLRKPPIVIGQALKLVGMIIAAITGNLWITVLGVSLFALGNSIWMPSLYSIPTELSDMNTSRVAAAFALMTACGFAVGFIAPVIGGWLTETLATFKTTAGAMAVHVSGIRWSVFIFSFFNLVSFIFAIRISETGVRKNNNYIHI